MRLIVFSGTSDGSNLCKWLCENNISADVYVATEYGEQVMPKMNGITVHIGRLDKSQMCEIFNQNTLVIDATHPYASEVTKNIKSACDEQNATYLRLLRKGICPDSDVITVKDTESAVNWLCNTSGNVLLTTGSKELEAYTKIPDYQNRLFIRVLPTASVIEKCEALGFKGSHIIAMQGPFSHEMNVAMLKQTKCEILVTKDTGKSGGFLEKQQAVKQVNAKMLMINRPTEEDGFDFEQIKSEILNIYNKEAQYPRFPLFISLAKKKVLVVGAGNIAKRRVNVLKDFGADITIIAKENPANLQGVQLREYNENDLDGVYLAVSTTNDRQTNHKVYLDCKKRNIPVSIADMTDESSFFFPAICKNKNLVAGIVSDGKDHFAVSSVAKKIRSVMEEEQNESR